MTKDAIIQTIRDAFTGAGLDPDDAHAQAVAGNIAQVWLFEQEWQREREKHVSQLIHVITSLEKTPFHPLALPTGVFQVLVEAHAHAAEIIRLDEIDLTATEDANARIP